MKIAKNPALLLAFSLSATATPQMCFDQAGVDYQTDPLLLMAISIKENHLQPAEINGSNSDETEDVCGMQINSAHYKKLKKFNITRERLLKDPCICVYSGAWILAHNFQSYGRNWDSVGIYNTEPRDALLKKRRDYATDIKNIYRILLVRKIIIDGSTGGNGVFTMEKLKETDVSKN